MGDSALDWEAAFGRPAPRCLEIGFGAGEVIGSLAENNPHIDYLGIEVHKAGVGRLLLRADQVGLRNLRVICHDAVEVFQRGIRDESIDEILVFFPDPWHKKRHHKRRLIDPPFAASMASKLRTAACCAWPPTGRRMPNRCWPCAMPPRALESLSADGTFVERPQFRPPTRFERRGARLGHGVWDLAYRKTL